MRDRPYVRPRNVKLRTFAKITRRERRRPAKKSTSNSLKVAVGGIVGAAVTAAITLWLTGLLNAASKAIAPTHSPVLVSVRHEAGHSGGCGSWIVNKRSGDLTPPPSVDQDPSAWERWV